MEAAGERVMRPTLAIVETDDSAFTDHAFPRSFEAFYARDLKSVIGLAYVLSGSRFGAEDLAQDAFLAAFRNWGRISAYDDPSAWVRRVVANRGTSRFRRRSAEVKALLHLTTARVEVPEISAEAAGIWEAVRRLPNRQSQVIALRYFDQRSIAEIARIIGCSENTVKTHIQRAKHALSERLEKENRP
jgi:RNA polymerase sigma-70 factor (sigma-E family)